MAEVVLDSWHFYIFLWRYPLINVPFHWGVSMASFTVYKFQDLCMWDVCTFNLDYMCPPCQTYFFHAKSMLLKGDFFGFWISIYWNFEARPMFETMLWTDCTIKNNKLILMSKILYLQHVELHVNCHIQY
jgi:hypothetical protein